MADNRLQAQRFELKYQISETVALSLRDFLSCYLELDEYGAQMPRWSYPVHSLYLDSSDLRLYHATINGDKNRYKLRIRFYEDRIDAPVFFEIKRRMNSTISKRRAVIHRDAVKELLEGHKPREDHLFYPDANQIEALNRFYENMIGLRASPKTHVGYIREAWINPGDNSVRVTLDREVRSEPHPSGVLKTQMHDPRLVFGDRVILELKFTNRFPAWFREMVRVFDLMQCGAAKYADGVAELGEHRVQGAFVYYPESRPSEPIAETDKSPNNHAADSIVSSTISKRDS